MELVFSKAEMECIKKVHNCSLITTMLWNRNGWFMDDATQCALSIFSPTHYIWNCEYFHFDFHCCYTYWSSSYLLNSFPDYRDHFRLYSTNQILCRYFSHIFSRTIKGKIWFKFYQHDPHLCDVLICFLWSRH